MLFQKPAVYAPDVLVSLDIYYSPGVDVVFYVSVSVLMYYCCRASWVLTTEPEFVRFAPFPLLIRLESSSVGRRDTIAFFVSSEDVVFSGLPAKPEFCHFVIFPLILSCVRCFTMHVLL